MFLRLIAALALLMALASCASLSEQECLAGNWEEIGQRDGRAGRTADYIVNHYKACDETGVTPDRAAWERGRQAGLRAYCTPDNAYDVGRSGRRLSPVCPAASLPALDRAHDRGWRYYRLTEEIRDLMREADDVRAHLVDSDDRTARATLASRLNFIQLRRTMLEARRAAVARP